jgi:type I restriction enzyme S subunit
MGGEKRVGDYVTLVRGITYKGSLVGKPGPALLGLGSIHPGGGFRVGDYKTYGGECPPKLMLVPGDLFVSLKGATKDGKMIGSVARVPPSVPSGRLTQDTVKLEFRDSNPETKNFLYWVLRTPQYRDYCGGRATGSAVVALSREDFLAYPVPSINSARKRIVELLERLDDKIELNRRMNDTLEAMAQALFANWIDSHSDNLEECTVQELIERGLLLIGDGYRAKNSELGADGLSFVRAGNLKADGFDLAGAETLSSRSVAAAGHKIGKVGDVAFTSKGTVGRIARVSAKTGAFVYSPQVCFWRSIVPDELNPNVLYRWMSTEHFKSQVASVCAQTDMAPYVSLQDQRKMVLQLPPAPAQQKIAMQLEPFDDRIAANAEQSRTLATLRDMLLAKLLSGLPPTSSL